MSTTIEPITESDIEMIRAWRNSSLISSVSFTSTFISAEQQAKWYSNFKNDNSQFAWIISYKEEKVGFASVKNKDMPKGEFVFSSLYIGVETYINSGIGAIAEFLVLDYMFSKYNMQKAICEVLHTNSKVIQLHKKFGFTAINNLEAAKDNGNATGYTVLELTKNSWVEKKPILYRILKNR